MDQRAGVSTTTGGDAATDGSDSGNGRRWRGRLILLLMLTGPSHGSGIDTCRNVIPYVEVDAEDC